MGFVRPIQIQSHDEQRPPTVRRKIDKYAKYTERSEFVFEMNTAIECAVHSKMWRIWAIIESNPFAWMWRPDYNNRKCHGVNDGLGLGLGLNVQEQQRGHVRYTMLSMILLFIQLTQRTVAPETEQKKPSSNERGKNPERTRLYNTRFGKANVSLRHKYNVFV